MTVSPDELIRLCREAQAKVEALCKAGCDDTNERAARDAYHVIAVPVLAGEIDSLRSECADLRSRLGNAVAALRETGGGPWAR